MEKQKLFSFESILREYEINSKEKKQNHRMKKLANIKEDITSPPIRPFVKEAVNKFRKLIDQIIDEANERRGIK